MTSNYEFANSPQQYAELVLRDSEQALQAAVSAVNPENPGADPLEVFPAPGEVRNEDVGLQLGDEQGQALRAAAAQLGFERPNDAEPSSLGLGGAHFIIEGGQPHKIVAEAKLVMEDTAAAPKTLIFSASPNRKLSSEAEKASCVNQFNEVLTSEYDVARRAAESLEGFRPLVDKQGEPTEQDLGVGYDIDANFQLVLKATGQFKHIGHVGTAAVVMLRIDREDYIDEQGNAKYRNQPATDQVIGIVHESTSVLGEVEAPIAIVTSATYQASRSVDAATAGLQANRIVGVATYGTERLATVNGTTVPTPRLLEQLPGEMHKLALSVEKLRAALA